MGELKNSLKELQKVNSKKPIQTTDISTNIINENKDLIKYRLLFY